MTGLKSGTLYPILIRSAENGLLDSRWLEPADPGRPPRHAYRILPKGLRVLQDAIAVEPSTAPKVKMA